METMANFFPRIDDLIENDLKHRSIRELRLLLRFGKSQFSRSAKKLGKSRGIESAIVKRPATSNGRPLRKLV